FSQTLTIQVRPAVVGWDSGARTPGSGRPGVTMSEMTRSRKRSRSYCSPFPSCAVDRDLGLGLLGAKHRAPQRGRVDIASGAGVLLLVLGGLGFALGLRGAGLPLLTVW